MLPGVLTYYSIKNPSSVYQIWWDDNRITFFNVYTFWYIYLKHIKTVRYQWNFQMYSVINVHGFSCVLVNWKRRRFAEDKLPDRRATGTEWGAWIQDSGARRTMWKGDTHLLQYFYCYSVNVIVEASWTI